MFKTCSRIYWSGVEELLPRYSTIRVCTHVTSVATVAEKNSPRGLRGWSCDSSGPLVSFHIVFKWVCLDNLCCSKFEEDCWWPCVPRVPLCIVYELPFQKWNWSIPIIHAFAEVRWSRERHRKFHHTKWFKFRKASVGSSSKGSAVWGGELVRSGKLDARTCGEWFWRRMGAACR